MNRNVGIISLGCVKNTVDSEQMLSLLTKRGYTITNEPEKAHVLIVNTCGFIQSAKEESIEAIFDMARYKEEGACQVLCVTGCLTQRYEKELLRDIPEIDCMLGVSQYKNIANYLDSAFKQQRVVSCARSEEFLESDRVLTTPSYSAYIRVSDGCNNRCSFCAIPLIRGHFRSRKMEDVLAEMTRLAKRGAKEQIIISQDTTRFGTDRGTTLKALLKEAVKIEGIEWLRVLYMYPDEVDDELLELMAANKKIMPYLDLPLQHISQRLLHKMNRRGEVPAIKAFLKKARDMGFCLRTTFIVGFPSETEEEFQELLDFVRETEFDRMGAFAYSPEDDTPAATFDDQIPEEVKQERLKKLMNLQATISKKRNLALCGTVQQVMITGHNGFTYEGRSPFHAPDADGIITVFSNRNLHEGDIVPVKITKASTYDLTGEVMDELTKPLNSASYIDDSYMYRAPRL